LAALFSMLRTIRQPDLPVSRQVETILDYYEPILKREYYDDWPKRQLDLEHLAGLVADQSDRAAFLSALALDPIELSTVDVEPLDEDEAPLVLSTIHSAKGLEFKAVFVIHALEGVLPSAYAAGRSEDLDEELRLLYVAVTRAADHLFISYPMVQFRRFQGQYFTSPSRFVADVPENLLEPWSLEEEQTDPLLAGSTDFLLAEHEPSPDPKPGGDES
jgi:DNA helicase-2/ATP-dependent DNA helicase PcrA